MMPLPNIRTYILENKFLSACFYLIYTASILYTFRVVGQLPSCGLDPSWVQALHLATEQNLAFGKDVIFTYGPLHMLATMAYHPDSHYLYWAGQIYLWALIAWVFAPYYKRFFFYFFILLAQMIPWSLDAMILVLAFGLVFRSLTSKNDTLFTNAIFLLFSGLFTLSKMSFLPIFLAFSLFGDLYRFLIGGRKFPYYTLSVAISLVLFWIISGNQLADLPSFLSNSLKIISGYAEAMQGFSYALKGFVVLVSMGTFSAALFYGYLSGRESNAYSEKFLNKEETIRIAAIFAAILLCGFFACKMGFVLISHYHVNQPILVGMFVMVLCLLQATQKPNTEKLHASNYNTTIYYTITLLLIFTSFQFMMFIHRQSASSPDSSKNMAWLTSAGDKEFNNIAYLNRVTELRKNLKPLQESLGEEILAATVSSFPYHMSQFLILGMDYKLHPLLQSYAAYHEDFREKELEFLQGSEIPEYLFVELASHGIRYPTHDLGGVLLQIFERYKPIRKIDFSKSCQPVLSHSCKVNEELEDNSRNVIFKKREDRFATETVSKHEFELDNIFDTALNLPSKQPDTIRIIEADIELNIWGKLLKLLYKAPEIRIKATRNTPKLEEEFKIVPAMMKTGFLLDPILADSDDLYVLAQSVDNSTIAELPEVNKIEFVIEPESWDWAYEKETKIRIKEIKFNRPKQDSESPY